MFKRDPRIPVGEYGIPYSTADEGTTEGKMRCEKINVWEHRIFYADFSYALIFCISLRVCALHLKLGVVVGPPRSASVPTGATQPSEAIGPQKRI